MQSYQFEKMAMAVKKNLPLGDFELNAKSKSFVGKRIAEAINNSESIVVYGDYDVDGIATSTMLQEFIQDVALKINKTPKIDITISTRYTSGYGMSFDKVKSLSEKYDLIIGVDHGGNAEFLELFDNEDGKMVVFDHHLSDNEYDFIINPATDGIKGISSGLVVKKFIDYFLEKTKLKINPEKYADLETLTIISDMAELNDYSRRRLEVGLRKINEKNRFVFKSKVGKINHKDLSFGVISKINAVGRMRDDVSFVAEWLQEENDYTRWKDTALLIDKINDEKKKLINKYFNIFMTQVEMEKDNNNSLKLYVADDIPIGLNGLIAQRLFQHTNKETIVMSLHRDRYTGSGRGYDIYDSLLKIQEAISTAGQEKAFKVGGHAAAIGINFEKDLLDKFSFHTLHAEVKKQKEVEIIDKINVSQLVEFSQILNNITEEIPLNKKFYFSLEDYNFEDIKRFSNNYASIRLNDDETSINAFVNLDVVKESHLRASKPLKVHIDELYSDNYNFKFSIEATLSETYELKNDTALKIENIVRAVS